MGRRLSTRLGAITSAALALAFGPLAQAAGASGGYQETVVVDSSQPGGATTAAWLAAGTTYTLAVGGRYQFGPGARFADAECSTVDGVTWVRDRFGPEPLDLLVGGRQVDWMPNSGVLGCDTVGHRYRVTITPTSSGPLSLAVAPGPDDAASSDGVLEVVVTGSGTAPPPEASTNETPPDSPPPPPPPPASEKAPASAPPPPQSSSPAAPLPSVAVVASDPRPAKRPQTLDEPPAAAPPGRLDPRPALEEIFLADRPQVPSSPDREVILEVARPGAPATQVPWPLIVLPLAGVLVVVSGSRRALQFATSTTGGALSLRRSSPLPWRVVDHTEAPRLSQASIERPVLARRPRGPFGID